MFSTERNGHVLMEEFTPGQRTYSTFSVGQNHKTMWPSSVLQYVLPQDMYQMNGIMRITMNAGELHRKYNNKVDPIELATTFFYGEEGYYRFAQIDPTKETMRPAVSPAKLYGYTGTARTDMPLNPVSYAGYNYYPSAGQLEFLNMTDGTTQAGGGGYGEDARGVISTHAMINAYTSGSAFAIYPPAVDVFGPNSGNCPTQNAHGASWFSLKSGNYESFSNQSVTGLTLCAHEAFSTRMGTPPNINSGILMKDQCVQDWAYYLEDVNYGKIFHTPTISEYAYLMNRKWKSDNKPCYTFVKVPVNYPYANNPTPQFTVKNTKNGVINEITGLLVVPDEFLENETKYRPIMEAVLGATTRNSTPWGTSTAISISQEFLAKSGCLFFATVGENHHQVCENFGYGFYLTRSNSPGNHDLPGSTDLDKQFNYAFIVDGRGKNVGKPCYGYEGHARLFFVRLYMDIPDALKKSGK